MKVKKAGKAFKKAKAGQMLKKEVHEFGAALKKHVHVSDVPKKWKKRMNGLHIEVSDEGAEAIVGELSDVEHTWYEIEESDVVQNVGKAFGKWADTDEVEAIEELDKEFHKSEEGQQLMQEWEDFGKALEAAVEETDNGIHIDNDALEEVEEEAEDIEDMYEDLEETHWHTDYEDAFKKAFSTKAAGNLFKSLETFEKSEEHAALKGEVEDVFEALDEHVEVSDVPEHWQEEIDELEEMEDDMWSLIQTVAIPAIKIWWTIEKTKLLSRYLYLD